MLFTSFQNPPLFERDFVHGHTREALIPPTIFCPFLYSMLKLCTLNILFPLVAVIFMSPDLGHQSVYLQNQPRHTLLTFFSLFTLKEPHCDSY